MRFLKNLFSKKTLKFTDKILGEMTTVLDNENTEDDCLWEGAKSFYGQVVPTSIFINGTSAGPNSVHLDAIRKFIDEIPVAFQKLDIVLQKEPDFIETYGAKWQDDFSLGDLSIEDEVEMSIAVCLDPVGAEDDTYIVFEWVDQDVFNISIQEGR